MAKTAMLRSLAVVTSVALAGGFVYCKATNTFPFNLPAKPADAMLSSSKSLHLSGAGIPSAPVKPADATMVGTSVDPRYLLSTSKSGTIATTVFPGTLTFTTLSAGTTTQAVPGGLTIGALPGAATGVISINPPTTQGTSPIPVAGTTMKFDPSTMMITTKAAGTIIHPELLLLLPSGSATLTNTGVGTLGTLPATQPIPAPTTASKTLPGSSR